MPPKGVTLTLFSQKPTSTTDIFVAKWLLYFPLGALTGIPGILGLEAF